MVGDQKELLLEENVLGLVREYSILASKPDLSDEELDRVSQILEYSSENACLGLWIDEIDHFMSHELGILTEKSILLSERVSMSLKE